MENADQPEISIWIRKVFKDKNYDKIQIEYPYFDTSGGYVAEMIFATVIGEKNEKEEIHDVIIKKGKDSIIQDPHYTISHIYANEVNVYSKFLPYFQELSKGKNVPVFKNIPHCYGTIAEDNQYIIILENLKTKGFKEHNLRIPVDLNHAHLVLDAYAKWHALAFALNDQQPKIFEQFGRCNKGFLDSKMVDLKIETVKKEHAFLVEMYRKRNKEHIIEKLEERRGTFGDSMRNSMVTEGEEYLVIRHGDCWNNNFLFHYNEGVSIPDKVVVIDWQGAVLGSPLLDFTQFLFFNCSRRELVHMDDLLKRYYNTLSKTLRELGSDPEKCFPWKNCLEAFKKYAPFAILAMPAYVRMSCKVETDEKIDIANAVQDGNFNRIIGEKLRDPEEYFNRIDGILELSIERGFL